MPVYGQTGISSSNTFGTINTFGNTSTYSGSTYYTPSYGITGYQNMNINFWSAEVLFAIENSIELCRNEKLLCKEVERRLWKKVFIEPKKGYINGNISIVCDIVNRLKSDASIVDLKKISNFFINHKKN